MGIDIIKNWGFLSTPSARRATGIVCWVPFKTTYFYPRPPRGGRLGYAGQDLSRSRISIHALREEGDVDKFIASFGSIISIHALREEGDV